MTGTDSWADEVAENPDKRLAFPVHTELITKSGSFSHEKPNFDGLTEDKKDPFVYIFAMLPMKGATGSIGAPIAVA